MAFFTPWTALRTRMNTVHFEPPRKLNKDGPQLILCATWPRRPAGYNNSIPIPDIKPVPEPLWCAEYTVKVQTSFAPLSWFLVHAYLLRMCTNVVDLRVMRSLCRREWNWQRNWQRVNQHSWDPWQWTTWSRRVTSDFNSVLECYCCTSWPARANCAQKGAFAGRRSELCDAGSNQPWRYCILRPVVTYKRFREWATQLSRVLTCVHACMNGYPRQGRSLIG